MGRDKHTGARAAPSRRSFGRRAARWAAGLFAFVLLVFAATAGLAVFLLSRGSIESVHLAGRIARAVEMRIGGGFQAEIGRIRLTRGPEGLSIEGDDVALRDPTGKTVVQAPRAIVAVDGWSLLRLSPVLREVELVGLSVVLTLDRDGSVSVSTVETRREPVAPPAQTAPLRLASFVDAVAAPAGALAILERVGLRDGTLLVDDRRNDRVATYSELSLVYSRPMAGETRLAMRAKGAHGRWGLSAVLRGLPGETRTLEAGVQNLAVSEILGFAEKGALRVHTDMPVSFDLKARLGADDRLEALEGEITGGSAQIVFDDPNIKPIGVEKLGGRFSTSGEARTIALDDLVVAGAGLRLQGRGSVDIPADASSGWRFAFSADGGVGRVDPRKPELRIESARAQGTISPGFTGIKLDGVSLAGPEVDVSLAGSLGRYGTRDGLALDLKTGRMPVDAVLAFWPSFSGPLTRRYFLASVDGGTVERLVYRIDFSAPVLADAVAGRPLPDDSKRLDIRITDGVMRPAPGLPVLSGITADGVVTGRTATVDVERAVTRTGAGAPMTLEDGRFAMADTAAVLPDATIGFRLRGGADAFFALLKQDALRNVAGAGFPDPADVKGSVDARVDVRMPLKNDPPPETVKLDIAGVFTGFQADAAIGKERLEASSMSFRQAEGRLVVKGEGRIGGAPAVFDYMQGPRGAEPEYSVVLTVDDQVRARRGLRTTGLIAGPVQIRATSRDGGGKGQVLVEADFARAAINGLLPTWFKPVGRPARAVMKVRAAGEDRFDVLDLVLDGGNGLTVRGGGQVAADGTILQASLSQVRLSPGDDMKVDVEKTGNGMRLTVRATALDARPFLKSALGPSAQGGSGGELELDVKANALQGHSGEVLSGAEFRMTLRSGETRDFRLAGRLGRAPVSGQTARSEAGAPVLVVESGDAGAFLRFVDLYRRMTGGALLMQLSPGSDPLSGFLVVQNFSLRNDPALAGVAANRANREGRSLIEDASVVSFTRLRVEFERAGNGIMTLREGVMWGPALGGTLEGTVDLVRDRIDMRGTFVPAYGLNNIPNQLPFFGSLLFGGPNEGLFAVNFRVSGSRAEPAVTFNPLSAVAPGFLRKFFGVTRPEESPVPPAPIPDAAPAPRR